MKCIRVGRLGTLAVVIVVSASARAYDGAVQVEAPSKPTTVVGEQEGAEDPPPSATPHEPEAPATDLGRESALLDAADAAQKASELALARARASEAVESLLARPESSRQDSDWRALLHRAGATAWGVGDAVTAKHAFEQVLDACARALPAEHPQLAAARANLASTLYDLGDLAGARVLDEQVLDYYTRKLPADSPDLALLRGNLAATLHALSDFRGARALREQVLEVYSRTLPVEDPLLQAARAKLAITLEALGEFTEARALLEQVLDVCVRTLPADHPDLVRAREQLANVLQTLGDLNGARVLGEQVLEAYTRTLHADAPELAVARGNLATTLHALGDLHGARTLEEQVLEVFTRTLPADDPRVSGVRGNLAATLLDLGDMTGACALQQQVLEFYARTLPPDDNRLALAQGNLAITLFRLGDVPVARDLFEHVLDVYARTLPPDHPDRTRVQGNLALAIREMGDFAGALALQEHVLEASTRTHPADHPFVTAARGNLAATLHDLGDLSGARALEEQVLEVAARTLPADHPSLGLARGNLAATLQELGELASARALQEQVLECSARTLPADHPDLALARGNLANTLTGLGELSGARALQEQVLEVAVRTLPEGHPDLARAFRNLAEIIATQSARAPRAEEGSDGADEDRERCTRLLLDMIHSQSVAARHALLTSSSREAEERCARLSWSLDQALTFAAGYCGLPPLSALHPATFALSETTRAAAIGAAAFQRQAAGAPRYAELRSALKRQSDALAGLAQTGTTSAEFQRALAQRESIERELVAVARERSGGASDAIEFDARQLAVRLGPAAAAVGFRSYIRWDVRARGEEAASGELQVPRAAVRHMCALVVRGVGMPGSSESDQVELTCIDLGPLHQIASAVNAWRSALASPSERGIAAGTDWEAAPRSRGAELRRLVFDPLLSVLGGVDRIVVALDDVLHLVPLDALPLDDDTGAAPPTDLLVGHRWRIESRCTLIELLAPSPPRTGPDVLIALGGASFESQPLAPDAKDLAALDDIALEPVEVASLLRGGAWERGFTPLTYTGLEVREIAALREEVTESTTSALVLDKRRASRASLEQLAPRSRWLHVATHGWFAPESVLSWCDTGPLDKQSGWGSRQSGEAQIRGMSPLLLCGLALAGANLPLDASGRAPGLITAEEIAALDLSGCELAVLSACDTNVGERRAGQGVASLQRALQMAGARSVITSLWKVPDEATRELMVDFYRRLWIERKPKHQALWEAKSRIRGAKDEQGRLRFGTRDWAAWVLTGAQDS